VLTYTCGLLAVQANQDRVTGLMNKKTTGLERACGWYFSIKK